MNPLKCTISSLIFLGPYEQSIYRVGGTVEEMHLVTTATADGVTTSLCDLVMRDCRIGTLCPNRQRGCRRQLRSCRRDSRVCRRCVRSGCTCTRQGGIAVDIADGGWQCSGCPPNCDDFIVDDGPASVISVPSKVNFEN